MLAVSRPLCGMSNGCEFIPEEQAYQSLNFKLDFNFRFSTVTTMHDSTLTIAFGN